MQPRPMSILDRGILERGEVLACGVAAALLASLPAAESSFMGTAQFAACKEVPGLSFGF